MFRDESEFAGWLRAKIARKAGDVRLGIGDDAAVVRQSKCRELVLTTDLSVEGVHFLFSLHPPRCVGHRAVARSLSDIAAMGSVPRFVLISLALSRRVSRSWAEQFYAGASALAQRQGVALVGGDTALVSGRVLIDVVAVGEVKRSGAVPRSGARPGDQLFVSGRLGLSALGLVLLRRGSKNRPGQTGAREAIHAHLYPEPRVGLGRYLSERRLASALIDLSDGLSTDLRRLCEASGVGARVWADRIPAPEVLHGVAKTPIELALHGGEDYELLFAVPRSKVFRIPAHFRGVPIHSIGEVQRSRECILVRTDGDEVPLKPGGFDHFAKRRS